MPQGLYSVLKPCQRAVGSPLNTPKNIKFAGYSIYMTFPQRLYSVHTTTHSVFTASMTFLQRASSCCSMFVACTQRAHSAHTAVSRRVHSVLAAIIAFNIFYLFFYYEFANIVICFYFSKQFVMRFNSCLNV